MDKFLKKYGTEGVSLLIDECVKCLRFGATETKMYEMRELLTEVSEDLKAALNEYADAFKKENKLE